MHSRLTTQERLQDLRISRGLTLKQLAQETGLSASALGRYENEETAEFSTFALAKLAQFYGVSSDYLLCLTENKNHPNTALYELHLSDEAVEKLREGKFNSRLLSELICHENFVRFMVDMEVHIDRIAEAHFQDMNLYMQMARNELEKQYHPDENDLRMRTLELADILPQRFVQEVVHQDIDLILQDLREAHRGSTATADEHPAETATPKDVEQMLRKMMDYEGAADEKRAFLVCETLKIDYTKLEKEDQRVFASVCKKSPILRDVMNQRGRARPGKRHH